MKPPRKKKHLVVKNTSRQVYLAAGDMDHLLSIVHKTVGGRTALGRLRAFREMARRKVSVSEYHQAAVVAVQARVEMIAASYDINSLRSLHLLRWRPGKRQVGLMIVVGAAVLIEETAVAIGAGHDVIAAWASDTHFESPFVGVQTCLYFN